MYYIQLTKNSALVPTVQENLYRGDALSRSITFLVPKVIGELEPYYCTVYLSYTCPDGLVDIVTMERQATMYNEEYYQYVLPFTNKMSHAAGTVSMWMQIRRGAGASAKILNSGTCNVTVLQSRSTDGYISDQQIEAIEQIRVIASGKADGISYNDQTRKVQLKNGNTAIGSQITVPSDDIADSTVWKNMTDT